MDTWAQMCIRWIWSSEGGFKLKIQGSSQLKIVEEITIIGKAAEYSEKGKRWSTLDKVNYTKVEEKKDG